MTKNRKTLKQSVDALRSASASLATDMDDKTRADAVRVLRDTAKALRESIKAGAVRNRSHAIKPHSPVHKEVGKMVEGYYDANSRSSAYPDVDVNLQEIGAAASSIRSIAKALEHWGNTVMNPRDDRADKLLSDLAGQINVVAANLGAARALSDKGHQALPASAREVKASSSTKDWADGMDALKMAMGYVVVVEGAQGADFSEIKTLLTKAYKKMQKSRSAIRGSISPAKSLKAGKVKAYGNGTYVDVKDLPQIVQRALKANGYRKPNIELIPARTTSLQSFPFEGNRAYNVFIDLSRNKVKEEKGSWSGPGIGSKSLTDLDATERPLPDNVLHIKGETGGRGSFARIYVNQKTLAPMLPSGEAVSPEEKLALQVVKGIKSGYRADEFDRRKLGRYGPENPLIISLISKGMLKKNARGAIMITTKGKNAAGSSLSF